MGVYRNLCPEEGRNEDRQDTCPPSSFSRHKISHFTHIYELLGFYFPPHEEQILCLCQVLQKVANTSPSSWTCLSSLTSVFQRGNQSISWHPKFCSQQHGIKDRAPGEGGWFFCGLNSVYPSKEGVNVLPVSHPCESHLFNLMRKLTIHCGQQSLSCSAPPGVTKWTILL